MNALPAFNPLELVMLILLTGGPGTPSSIPPQPEDPLLFKVAPAECLAYVAWAGTAKADSASTNHTEQLLAEPTVQKFITEASARLTKAMQQGAVGAEDPATQRRTQQALDLLQVLTSHPAALFLTRVELNSEGPPRIEGGMIVKTGSDTERVQGLLTQLQQGQPPGTPVEIGRATFTRMQFPNGPPIIWGFRGQYLMVAVSDSEASGMQERAAKPEPAWLSDLRRRLTVPRFSSMFYVNAQKILSLIPQEAPGDGPTPQQVIQELGLSQVESLALVTGLDDSGCVSRAEVKVAGQPSGILSWLEMAPLTKADLQSIPAKSSSAIVWKLNTAQVFDTWMGVVRKLDPQAAQDMAQGLAMSEAQLGLKIREDLLGSLGDVWRLYANPSAGGPTMGWTLSVAVRDRARLEQAHSRLLALANAALGAAGQRGGPPGAFPPGGAPPGVFPPGAAPPGAGRPGTAPPGVFPPGGTPPGAGRPGGAPPGVLPPGSPRPPGFPGAPGGPQRPGGLVPPGTVQPPGALFQPAPPGFPGGPQRPGGPGAAPAGQPKIQESTVAGHKVYTLVMPPPVPFAPAWCITDKELVIAMSAAGIQAHLSASPSGNSLADSPLLASAFGSNQRPLMVAVADTRQMYQTTMPLLQIGLAGAAAQMPGVNLDSSKLPSTSVIARHLQPTAVVLHRTPAGVELTSRQTFPGGNMAAAAPVSIALLLPAVQAAREAARRTQSINNLKQLALGVHNFADTHRSLPAGYNSDSSGRALLSWRVHLLPFLDAGDLYQQFHLNEPWDSPHNKTLIPRMPAMFALPGQSPQSGKTPYLAVGGAQGAFIPPKSHANGTIPLGTTFAEFTDGTSNTLMFVEVAPERAVTWTQPADFAPDLSNPMQGLGGVRPGGFLAALVDGSTRFVSDKTPANTLKALLGRNDGIPVPPER